MGPRAGCFSMGWPLPSEQRKPTFLKTRKPQSFNAISCTHLLTLRSSWGGRSGSCAYRRERAPPRSRAYTAARADGREGSRCRLSGWDAEEHWASSSAQGRGQPRGK